MSKKMNCVSHPTDPFISSALVPEFTSSMFFLECMASLLHDLFDVSHVCEKLVAETFKGCDVVGWVVESPFELVKIACVM